MAWPPLAARLGRSAEGPPMGEPTYGVAIECRLSTGHALKFQDERRCDTLCAETGVRVLCAGTKRKANYPQSVREQFHAQREETKEDSDEIKNQFMAASITLYIHVKVIQRIAALTFIVHNNEIPNIANELSQLEDPLLQTLNKSLIL